MQRFSAQGDGPMKIHSMATVTMCTEGPGIPSNQPVPHSNNHKAGAIVPPSMYFEEDDLYEKHYNT